MVRVPTDHTAKRLLVRSVLAGRMMTLITFLRTIGTLDLASTDTSFGRAPLQLLGDMGQIRGVQVRIHAPRLKAHARHVQPLIGKLRFGVLSIELVDRTIDLLP